MSQNQARLSFLRALRRLRAAFWRRRVAFWLVRTAWLTLLVPTGYMAGYLWLGWQVRWQDWLLPMAAVAAVSLLWAMRPIRLKQMAYHLDHRLGLRTQLITAFEVSRVEQPPDRPENLVAGRLLHDTVNIIVGLRGYVRAINRNFWLEMNALIGVAALLGALLTLDALAPHLPQATPVSLPTPLAEPSADEVIPPPAELFPPPFPPDIQVQTLSRPALERALAALADALRDQAITRSVADALDRGDLPAAAENLRRLADRLADLSAQARAGLGDALQEAADNIGGDAPGLTPPLQAGSRALSADDLQAAGQALSELADALESLEETGEGPETARVPSPQAQAEQTGEPQPQPGEQPEPPPAGGSGGGNGEGQGNTPPTEEERLAVEGQPLELESDPDSIDRDRVLQPAELDATPGNRRTDDSPFTRGSPNAAADLGPDPLTYPWSKRELVRRYFTP